MKTDVKISIRGIQNNVKDDSVEVVSLGEMYEKDDLICVSYEEGADAASGMDCDIINSLLKIHPNQVEMIKKGSAETHMVFVQDKDTISYYSTPFGEMEVTIHTNKLERLDTENGFQIFLNYALEINTAHVSDCNVDIRVEHMRGKETELPVK